MRFQNGITQPDWHFITIRIGIVWVDEVNVRWSKEGWNQDTIRECKQLKQTKALF